MINFAQNQLKARIEAFSHDGRGIATVNNKKVFIKNALPGELLTYRLLNRHSTYDEAQALAIIEPSPARVTPPCQHFGICGGCQLQYMSNDLQQELKHQTLFDQLNKFAHIKLLHELPPLTAKTLGYRRKARLGVKFVFKKNKVLVGFREKASRYLADLNHCAVLHPKIGEKLFELSQLIASLEAYQHIPQVEFAMGDEEAALVFRHLNDLSLADQNKLIQFGEMQQFHIYIQPNPPASIVKLYPVDEVHRLTYSLPGEALTFQFHPLDFTQINLDMNRLMIQKAMQLLDPQSNETVLDLFCGMGNFSLPLAKRAAHVVGVEGSMEMVLRARENALYNGLENTDFYAANLMEPTPDASWLKQSYDKLLLDPPRAGAKEMLPFFVDMNIKKIAYISCNPATLARDSDLLVRQYGYQLTHAGVMNMFPHTAHIEAMAIFVK